MAIYHQPRPQLPELIRFPHSGRSTGCGISENVNKVDMLNFGQYDAFAQEGIWFYESLRC